MDYVEISSDDEDDELIIDYINSTGLDYFTGDDKLFYQILAGCPAENHRATYPNERVR